MNFSFPSAPTRKIAKLAGTMLSVFPSRTTNGIWLAAMRILPLEALQQFAQIFDR